MSRRKYGETSLFEDGQDTYRRGGRDSGGYGRHDDSGRVRDHNDTESRQRDGWYADRHEQSHGAVLREDFADSRQNDSYSDQRYSSDDRRYDDYVDSARTDNFDDRSYDRYGDDVGLGDTYAADNYNDFGGDRYSQGGDRYGQDDGLHPDNYMSGGGDNVNNYYDNPTDTNLGSNFYVDRNADGRDKPRRDDHRTTHRDSRQVKRNQSSDRDSRFGRENRDSNKKSDRNMSQSGGKDRVSSSERYSRSSNFKQSGDEVKGRADSACGGSSKRRDTDKIVRSGSDSKGSRPSKHEAHNKSGGLSKDKHNRFDSKSMTGHSQGGKTHGKSSKISTDSKMAEKRSSTGGRVKQSIPSSRNIGHGTKDSKRPKGDAVSTASKAAGRSASSRRGNERGSVSDLQRRRTTSAGDKRERSGSVRESVSRTAAVSRSNYDDKNEHSSNRQRNSGGPAELKDDIHYHDDDVLSILADDDRFARETRGLLGDDLSRNDRHTSRRSQSSVPRFEDRFPISQDTQYEANKGTQPKGFVHQENRVIKYNTFNNRQNMYKTGFYKKKPISNLRGKSTIARGRGSRFVDKSDNGFNQGDMNQVYSETDNNFAREQENHNNEETKDPRERSSNVTGKKTVFSGKGGNSKGTFGKMYDKYSKGSWYRNNKFSKLSGISKNQSSGHKYSSRSTNSNSGRNKFSTERRKDNDNYYNETDEQQNYNARDYDGNGSLDYGREQQVGRDDSYDGGVEREDIRNVNIGEAGQQQIIFIPNPDFQGNVDPYGKVINPDMVDNQGNLSQVPFQLLPSNMPADGTQRSDQLIFIPFVNNQLQPEEAVPVQLNADGQIQTPTVEQSVDQAATTAPKIKKPEKKGLSVTQRSLLRKKLIAKRRQKLEKEIERKVLKKLLESAGASSGGVSAIKKTKAAIKRISPPTKKNTAKTLGRKQAVLEDVSDEDKEKYDDVSDLESVSDDEDSFNRKKGALRKAFRKPGEPRLNQKPIIQSKSDVRRVVDTSIEKKKSQAISQSSERYSKGRKRTVYEVHDDEESSKITKSDGKKWERDRSVGQDRRGHRSMSPLQITVDNDKFSSPVDNRNQRKQQDRADKGSPGRKYSDRSHPTSGNRGYRRGSDDRYDDDGTDSDSGRRSDRFTGKYSSKFEKRDERTDRGKYRDDYADDHDRRRRQDDRDRDYHRQRRGSSEEGRPERRRSRPNRWSNDQDQRYTPQPQQIQQQSAQQQGHLLQNPGLIQQNQAIMSMGDQQSLQQSILTSQSQQLANQIQPNLSLVNAGHSFDPSLPPVPQLSQSNILLRPDMSLPPPQVSVMGNQTSLSQLAYQPALQSQSILSLQNNTIPSNQQHQLQQASLQQQQQQLLQLQQQTLLNSNRNQLGNSTGVNQGVYQSSPQTNSQSVFPPSAVVQQSTNTVQQGYNMPTQQNNQQTDRQLQQIQTNLGSQVNLAQQIQTQQETQKPLLSMASYNQQNNSNQGSVNTNAGSQLSSRTQSQGVRGVIGTLSNNQQPKPLLGSFQIQNTSNQSGSGSTPQFKGQVYGYQSNTPPYRSRSTNDSSHISRSNDSSHVSRSPASTSQYSKHESRYGSGRSTNQNLGSSRTGNISSGSSRAPANQTSGSSRTPANQSSGSSRASAYQSSGSSRAPANQSSGSSRAANQSTGSSRNLNHSSGGGRSGGSSWKHTGGNGNKEAESDGESDDDNDVGQLMCTKCDKVFLSKRVMRRHVRWHDKSASGQYDVRCDRCELAFLTPSGLNNHSDEKHSLDAWNCHLCDLTFPHSQTLVRHFQKENHQYVTNKYICPTCSAVFGNVKMLAHHKQGHMSALRQHGSSRRVVAKFV